MSVENKQIRESFNKYLEDNGVMLKWVSKQTNIPSSSLSRWRNNNLDLGKEKIGILKEFLENRV